MLLLLSARSGVHVVVPVDACVTQDRFPVFDPQVAGMDEDELFVFAKQIQAPFSLVQASPSVRCTPFSPTATVSCLAQVLRQKHWLAGARGP